MNIGNTNHQQLESAYMILTLRQPEQYNEPASIDFCTFEKLMTDDQFKNNSLSKTTPANFFSIDGVTDRDYSLGVQKLVFKAFEKGLMKNNNCLANQNDIEIQDVIKKYSTSMRYNSNFDIDA